MTRFPTIGLLGADKQAAVSAAAAYPERQFLFATDQRVADGWDLPNVRFVAATPRTAAAVIEQHPALWVPLCGRWLDGALAEPANVLGSFDLDQVLGRLHALAGETVLTVAAAPAPGVVSIVKGNAWHRPDGTLVSAELDAADVPDPYGCGTVFQEHWPWQRLLLATGRRWANGAVALAVVQVHSEVCARDDVIGAGETVRHPFIAVTSLEMLDALDHRGFFTFNWIERDGAARLTSFRPVPRALFGTLRRAGLDLFAEEAAGRTVARPGCRFVVDITYSPYQPLAS
jgi:hypothetical protein